MGVEISDIGIIKESLDQRFKVTPVHQIGIDHLMSAAERAQRDRTDAERFGNRADLVESLEGPFADKYGMARPIGGVRGLMDMVEQQQALARFASRTSILSGKPGVASATTRWTPLAARSSSDRP